MGAISQMSVVLFMVVAASWVQPGAMESDEYFAPSISPVAESPSEVEAEQCYELLHIKLTEDPYCSRDSERIPETGKVVFSKECCKTIETVSSKPCWDHIWEVVGEKDLALYLTALKKYCANKLSALSPSAAEAPFPWPPLF
ncbi:hypothetical protein H6P81_012098 [Aristolochia fimbriata]|uniref:Prolamin-like domain-containing protein n=1 Tax=Aristolochia fimbriata TaxID=158543 RepID=A0AAV7EAU9_ARIFI|nr:hypothetical protein H6P81_012098 [Aristolochia fimbriata]